MSSNSIPASVESIGWLLMLPAAPLSGLLGYLLARRLARQLPQ
jgi:hypothetical protein